MQLNEQAELIALEEKSSVSNTIAARINAIHENPDAPVRARIYGVALMIGGAELLATCEGPAEVATQLRRLADRFTTQARAALN